MRQKNRDLKVTDPDKAQEISTKADQITAYVGELGELSELLDVTTVNKTALFLGDYLRANANILVVDVINALINNGLPHTWITYNPNMIVDNELYVKLIICSYLQGNNDDKQI